MPITLKLDEYEAANLLVVLRAVGITSQPNPFSGIDRRDSWVPSVLQKLEHSLELFPCQEDGPYHSNVYGALYPDRTPSEHIKIAITLIESGQLNADKGRD